MGDSNSSHDKKSIGEKWKETFSIKGHALGFFLKIPTQQREMLESITFGLAGSYVGNKAVEGTFSDQEIVTFKKGVTVNTNQYIKPKAWWGYMREWFGFDRKMYVDFIDRLRT